MPKTKTPKNNKVKFEVFVETDQLPLIDAKADAEGLSRSAYVRMLINRAIAPAKSKDGQE